ncbi:AgmX/PglI C-terminal domain-containing protein [Myxococcus landrumensis]|uniref:Energy transducer TonB n=1 Tax=Myxococcus landrumensis TaxID=2813577 RepID=A0ABX7NDB8_9BACT|nr:AgmX/PglI C-terminal domain-containing protein [Myxococcus landrumus]QSQ16359.1 energy transducer TonB [Myxococcus landrumus]
MAASAAMLKPLASLLLLAAATPACRHAPEERPAAPAPSPGTPFDAPSIQAAIRANRHHVTTCYEQTYQTRPFRSGKVTIKFTLDPEGKVTKSEVVKTTIHEPALESCIVERTKTWLFPKPPAHGGAVTYPFILKPAESREEGGPAPEVPDGSETWPFRVDTTQRQATP